MQKCAQVGVQTIWSINSLMPCREYLGNPEFGRKVQNVLDANDSSAQRKGQRASRSFEFWCVRLEPSSIVSFLPVIACLCSPSPYKYSFNQLPAVIQRLVSVLFYRCVVTPHPTVIESEQFSIFQSAVESLNISSKTHLRLKFSFAASCFRSSIGLHWVKSIQVRRPTGLLNSCVFDPMPFDFDIIPSFFERFPRSTRDVMAVSHGPLVDWVETPEAHVIKADLPGMCFTASSLTRPSMFVCHKIQGPQLDMRLTVLHLCFT